MDKGPSALRAVNLLERLRSRKGLAGAALVDHGDVPIEAGWWADTDPIMKNWQRIIDYLPQVSARVEEVMGAGAGTVSDTTRLLLLGGDYTSHAAAMAGLQRHNPDARLAIAWFDAHGD